jgi:predicted SAM-dependent methyltransferase
MLPYGYKNQRKNVLSPSTLSLERHRLLWLFLTNETDFFTAEKRVLHIAPEQCFVKRFKKQQNLSYTTADLNSPLADVKADVCDLPFEKNTFDLIFCNHVLEHIKDDKKAMQELFRVMAPGGMGIFQIPLDQHRAVTYEDDSIVSKKDRAVHFGQYDHVRIYGMDYFDRLESVGFKTAKVNYTSGLTKDQIDRHALLEGELLPVCYKAPKI